MKKQSLLIVIMFFLASASFSQIAEKEKNKANENFKSHNGFIAAGEDTKDNGFSDLNEIKVLETNKKSTSSYVNSDCSILWANGNYQKPNITISKGKIRVSLGRNVTKIQLRSVPGNGIRYFRGGTHKIPNGEYVLSLFGSTYPNAYIKACVSYD